MPVTEILSSEYGIEQQFNPNDFLWMVPWKQFGFDYCGVYLIGPDAKWPMKIGVSDSVPGRLDKLQTAHWLHLACHGFWICESRKAAQEVERHAHECLERDNRRLVGEWFDVDLRRAKEIVEFAGQSRNVEMAPALPDNDKFSKVFAYLRTAVPAARNKTLRRVSNYMSANNDDDEARHRFGPDLAAQEFHKTITR